MNRTILGALSVGIAILAVALVAAAWSGESSAEAKADFCSSLDSLSSTVTSYEGVDPRTATNEELDEAADDIADAYDEVLDDAEDWANAYDNPVAEAYDDLYWEIESIPGDYTVAESLEEVEDELSAFPQAFDETFDGSGCDTV